MGSYNYSKEMLIEELTEFLNDIEGDFNSKDLIEVLEFMKDYAPTSDSSQIKLKNWIKKLKETGDLK